MNVPDRDWEAGGGGKPVMEATAAHPHEIVLDVDAHDARGLLHAAADHMALAHGLHADPVARALQRREQAGSTALGYGVAIPHARIAGITRPLTLFMRTRRPIQFGAPDGKDASSFFILMVPIDGDPEEHLQLLARIAGAFADRDFRDDLSRATTAQQVGEAFARRFAR